MAAVGSGEQVSSSLLARQRIVALDVVRGVAVGGILLANVMIFFGLIVLTPDQTAALPTAPADRVVSWLERVLVEGKFYSIFSLLFGVGFGVQLSRGGQTAVPRFRRRLRILLAIGAVHAFLIWSGDILMLYALLGFSMPWFARRTDRGLLQWTVGLLAIPTALYVIALVVWSMFGSAAPLALEDAAAGGIPPDILALLNTMGTGGIADALIGNLVFLVGRWLDLFATMRFPKVLGMFVLGLWLVRRGIALNPAAHRDVLVRWRRWGLLGGLPANFLSVWAFDQWPYMPPSIGGLLGVAGQAVGFPLLALGYASAITLMVVDGGRVTSLFAPMGRMALTNYLTHSIICVILSYGFGFGLWGQIGASTAAVIAIIIVLAQIPLSAWWLTRYRFGPAEWVWRRLTYQTRLDFRVGAFARQMD